MNASWLKVRIENGQHRMAKKLLEKANNRPLSRFVQSIVEKYLKEDGRRRNIITVEELVTDDVFLLSNEEIFEVLNRLRQAENALIEELSRRLGNAQGFRSERETLLHRGGDRV